ncbi:hypothetical protein ScPMuIL_016444 [Solemya velum]
MPEKVPLDGGIVISPSLDQNNSKLQYFLPNGDNCMEVLEVREIIPTFEETRVPDASDSLSEEVSDGPSDRASWGGKMEFLLTCVGYAVGLGNVWRFPYLCYRNGGGAFLIPYTIMLALVGLPLFYMELAFGQFASLGPIAIWRINPLMKGLGYAMVIVSWLIGLYYNVVIAQTVYYFFASMTSELPWASCNNTWNTNSCLPYDIKHSSTRFAGSRMYLYSMPSNILRIVISSFILGNLSSGILELSDFRTPSEEYYKFHVLEQSDSIDNIGGVSWRLALCLLFSWSVVFIVLLRGIKSLGKVVYFTAIFPYIMLTILLIRGLTLDGAVDGIVYYLKPDFSKLAEPRVWSDAATQIFYSLSACSGGLIAMASYNKFNNNCYRDSIIVAFINCGTSIFAGLVIFSILGFMAYEKGVTVDKVVDGGPGLAFEAYPEALVRMPVAPMWSIFFFLMMATLGFGSEFSIVECVLSALTDEYPWILGSRKRSVLFRLGVITVSFLLGLPMVCKGGIYVLNLVDYSVGGFPLLVVGFFECVALNWIYGLYHFSEDIYMMIGKTPNTYLKVCWKVVSPLIMLILVIFNAVMYEKPDLDNVPYPEWALAMGYLIVLFPIVVIPGWFLFYFCRKGGYRMMKSLMEPLPQWGPARPENRKNRYEKKFRNVDCLDFSGNPEVARLIGSNISDLSTSTQVSQLSNATPNGSMTTLPVPTRPVHVAFPNTLYASSV